MTKQEFEELTDISVSDEVYQVIEAVYMNFDRWHSKKEFADFFSKNGGMQAMGKLHHVHFEAKKLREEIKTKQEQLKEMHILYGLHIGG